MAHAVEADEATNPPDVRLFSPAAVVPHPDRLANAVEQLRRLMLHGPRERQDRARTGEPGFARVFVRIVGERCQELPTPPGAQYAESALGSAGPA